MLTVEADDNQIEIKIIVIAVAVPGIRRVEF
jgi:hypothetical protein